MKNSSQLSRRTIVQTAAAVPLLMGLPNIVRAASSPIVETAGGKVAGYTNAGVEVFKGIPYGADTSGKSRFLPPRQVAPWTGVREAIQFGNIAPQQPLNLEPMRARLF